MTGSGWRIFDDPVRFIEAVGPMDLEQEAMNRLPLAICRRLADLLGGDINVTSESGKGSVFKFTLPLRGQEKQP